MCIPYNQHLKHFLGIGRIYRAQFKELDRPHALDMDLQLEITEIFTLSEGSITQVSEIQIVIVFTYWFILLERLYTFNGEMIFK
jgi:hypothetical protein